LVHLFTEGRTSRKMYSVKRSELEEHISENCGEIEGAADHDHLINSTLIIQKIRGVLIDA